MPLPMDPPNGRPDPQQTPVRHGRQDLYKGEGLGREGQAERLNQARIDELEAEIERHLDQIKLLNVQIKLYDDMTFLDESLKEDAQQDLQARIDGLNDRVNNLTSRIIEIKTGVQKHTKALSELDALLEKGDIEGAFMLVQTDRALSLDKQIAERLKELQARNEKIKSLNDELANISGADKDLRESERRRKVQLRGQIDKLNADSQLDTISLQSLINKRNQALEMLTNLLQKFQKLLDSIVANMR